MRIIHVSTAKTWRGGEQQLAYLLKALHQQGIEQEIMCAGNSPMYDFCKDQTAIHHTITEPDILNIGAAWELYKICRPFKNTIVHTHDSHAHTIAYLSSILFGNKTAIIVHRRVDFPVAPNIFSKYKYNHARIKRFICVSEAIKKILLPSIKYPEKAVVIYSGIDFEKYFNAPKKDSLRMEFSIDTTSLLIGNFSALAPHKDYRTFLLTAKILLKRNPSYRFVIVGDGPSRRDIEQLINEWQLGGAVFMTGFRKNISEIFKELDVFLMPSKTEGLGTIILDAFACGIPVVATESGGIPELVAHEVTGLLAPVGDAEKLADKVDEMNNNAELRTRIIQAAADKARHFDYRNTASSTLDIYHQILKEEPFLRT